MDLHSTNDYIKVSKMCDVIIGFSDIMIGFSYIMIGLCDMIAGVAPVGARACPRWRRLPPPPSGQFLQFRRGVLVDTIKYAVPNSLLAFCSQEEIVSNKNPKFSAH